MTTISVCMIVKNEERLLERCLNSLTSIADEIIIVDTGSIDHTKAIAKTYTDKIYDFKWIQDFSAARNFAFSKCTMDYIYSADADEVLDEVNQTLFLKLKQVLLPEIEIVQMRYTNQLEHGTVYNFNEEYRPKLFKRLREFLWIDPIHESVRLNPVVYDSEIQIQHVPETNHAKRDFEVFEKVYAPCTGNRLSKKLHHMYAQELFLNGDNAAFEKAFEIYLPTLSDSLRDNDELMDALCVLTHHCRCSGKERDFHKYTLKGITLGGCSELCYELGVHYKDMQDYAEASTWFYNAWKETECSLGIRYKKMSIAELHFCYQKLGYEDGILECEEALDEQF